MAQRSDQRTRDPEFDVDGLEDLESPSESDTSGGLARLGGSSGLFSVKTFLLALGLSGAAVLAGNAAIPFLGGLAGLVGVFAVGFGFGLVGEARNYVEVGLAGAMATGAAVVLGNLVLTALGIGVPLAALGVGSGLVVAIVGHYLGRDLREGLTRSV